MRYEWTRLRRSTHLIKKHGIRRLIYICKRQELIHELIEDLPRKPTNVLPIDATVRPVAVALFQRSGHRLRAVHRRPLRYATREDDPRIGFRVAAQLQLLHLLRNG